MTRTHRLLVATAIAAMSVAGPAAAAGDGPPAPAPARIVVALPGLPSGAEGTLTLTAPSRRSSPRLSLVVTGLSPSSLHTLRLGSWLRSGGRAADMTLRAGADGTLRVQRVLAGTRLRPAGSAAGSAPSVWDDTDMTG